MRAAKFTREGRDVSVKIMHRRQLLLCCLGDLCARLHLRRPQKRRGIVSIAEPGKWPEAR